MSYAPTTVSGLPNSHFIRQLSDRESEDFVQLLEEQGMLSKSFDEVEVELDPRRVKEIKERYPQAAGSLDFTTIRGSEDSCSFAFNNHYLPEHLILPLSLLLGYLLGETYLHYQGDRFFGLERENKLPGFAPLVDAITLHEVGHMRLFEISKLFYITLLSAAALGCGACTFGLFTLTKTIAISYAILFASVCTLDGGGLLGGTIHERYADRFSLWNSTELGLIYYIEYNAWEAAVRGQEDPSLFDSVTHLLFSGDPHPLPGLVSQQGKEIYRRRFGKEYAVSPELHNLLHHAFSHYMFNTNADDVHFYPEINCYAYASNDLHSVKGLNRALMSTWDDLAPGTDWAAFYA